MKILLVNKFLHPNGGSESYTFKLGEFLQLQGHEVQYFGMEHKDRIVGNRVGAYTSNMDFNSGSRIVKLTYPLKTIYSNEARKKIKLVLNDFKPDIVHLNNINFQLTPSIIYEIKKEKIPIVQTVHDVQIACPNHRFYIEHEHTICTKCSDGNYIECTKNKCIQNSKVKSFIASIESYFYHARNTYNLVDLFICPSKFMASMIHKGGVEKKRINVMYNFSDLVEWTEVKPSNEKYCLYFGRLSKEKGIETLLGIIKEMPDILIKVAGKGPYEDFVREYAGRYKNIEFLGFKTGNELNALVTNAQFTFCCSEWYENCPLSIVESQSLGTPVIGSDLGGTKELIDNGVTGIVYEGLNAAKLKESIIQLWQNSELLRNMSDNCRSRRLNTIDIYSKELLSAYKNLV